ncbi:hypothetical protein F2Q69_00027950 [Brassica cretica]|uniref:Uncharacterized protein n=1 Tax=Brassica cretica TaxID=69181 RepID=A0A8S9RZ37_BRACR|nr:hypothetical protein F2Q69_00027950 [Brassica cretica]
MDFGSRLSLYEDILGNKLEEIHLGEGRSHDGSFLKGLREKDPRLGEEYLKNKKEAREAEKKAQKQTKKKEKSASTSTAAPTSGPSPSTPRSERTDPSGYVPPRQSPRAAGKFQIIHLGSVASPGQPIDAEEAKLALDTTSEAIQQLATAMQTLTSVVGQIASIFPRGEEETDDPQQQDDQGN